jgi:hypothetical protein
MMKFTETLTTAGDGHWSNVHKQVKCTKLTIPYIDDEEEFGELRVHFDNKTWDCDTDGLIYTDRLFLKELRTALDSMGLAGADVDYSEQGMQGETYVSLDVGGKFLKSWLDKVGVKA